MPRTPSRRHFLQASAGTLAVGAAAAKPAASAPLPAITFGKAKVTKLIIGSNPLYGYSHFNSLYSRMMREWMTQDRRMEILHGCEKAGINTWQVHYADQVLEDYRRYRDEGGKMNLLLLGMGDVMRNFRLLPSLAKLNPLGVAHHGNMTDDFFRDGKKQQVKDWCKAVRDAGLTVGVSAHNPAVLAEIEDEGWDVDYYMTCMYRVSRTAEQAREEYGEAPVGEIYMERDPERMLKFVRQTRKTCFAFKVLGSGT